MQSGRIGRPSSAAASRRAASACQIPAAAARRPPRDQISGRPRTIRRMAGWSRSGSTGPAMAWMKLTARPASASPRADSSATFSAPPLAAANSARITTCMEIVPTSAAETMAETGLRAINRGGLQISTPDRSGGVPDVHVVLVADHAAINGGQAKVAIESALGLAARGIRVSLFAAVGPVDPRLEAAGIRVVCLEQDDVTTARSKLAFAAQAIWNGPASRALARELAACDPRDTVVHVHAFAKALSPSIGPALRASGLPCLYTMHEFFLVCPTGGFYAYPEQRICHRTPMSTACIGANCDARSYPRKVARLIRHVGLAQVARLPELFGHVVTISDLQERVVRPLMPRRTVFHRVDNPLAVAQAPGHDGPPGDVLFVGRI